MFQPDLFSVEPATKREEAQARARPLDLAGVIERLTATCERPRYSFMVLNLIAQASTRTGSAGPYVFEGGQRVSIRDWLCDALVPVAQRDPRRIGLADKVRSELLKGSALPAETDAAAKLIDDQVRRRVMQSGRTNVSRAVSELVRAGFVRRHYEGYKVDHQNRGGRRVAVYTLTEEVRGALKLSR
ncbi:hypothetical protein ACMGDM_16950 [Sphingomonas sp. DT-51]|uniref:hypothetical protein n=1 Tax=Sphingomonas sp. DT-51 TaxID=3396165 RepID=UPI003F1952BE